jgi:hypothetical protein
MFEAIIPQIERVAAERPAVAQASLDPADWKHLRSQGHRMLDDMFDYIENIRDRPVWQPMADRDRARFREGLPRSPSDLGAVHEEFLHDILPFAAGNVHPGFMGWVHGAGTPVGMLAEMLAAGLNANLGGRDQAPVEVEIRFHRCRMMPLTTHSPGLCSCTPGIWRKQESSLSWRCLVNLRASGRMPVCITRWQGREICTRPPRIWPERCNSRR